MKLSSLELVTKLFLQREQLFAFRGRSAEGGELCVAGDHSVLLKLEPGMVAHVLDVLIKANTDSLYALGVVDIPPWTVGSGK